MGERHPTSALEAEAMVKPTAGSNHQLGRFAILPVWSGNLGQSVAVLLRP